MDFDTFEVLYEFNKNIHHGVLCLEALTKHDGFDRETISILAADVVKAKGVPNWRQRHSKKELKIVN